MENLRGPRMTLRRIELLRQKEREELKKQSMKEVSSNLHAPRVKIFLLK